MLSNTATPKYYGMFRDAVLRGDMELRPLIYRAKKIDGTYAILSTRGFVLTDSAGEPEYFGGIIISH